MEKMCPEEAVRSNIINIRKIKTYNYVIVHTRNCAITIYTDSEKLTIEPHRIILIERNITFSVIIRKIKNNESPYDIISVNKESMGMLRRIIEACFTMPKITARRYLNDKVLSTPCDELTCTVFSDAKRKNNKELLLYKLAYIFCRLDIREKAIVSLFISASSSFVDTITSLLETDLSKKWQLRSIAIQLHMPSISIRKRLESEKTSFNQVLLDLRMKEAAKLVLDKNKQIGQISGMVGISSTPYFIKVFREYYGLTPKQFYLYLKGDKDDLACHCDL